MILNKENVKMLLEQEKFINIPDSIIKFIIDKIGEEGEDIEEKIIRLKAVEIYTASNF